MYFLSKGEYSGCSTIVPNSFNIHCKLAATTDGSFVVKQLSLQVITPLFSVVINNRHAISDVEPCCNLGNTIGFFFASGRTIGHHACVDHLEWPELPILPFLSLICELLLELTYKVDSEIILSSATVVRRHSLLLHLGLDIGSSMWVVDDCDVLQKHRSSNPSIVSWSGETMAEGTTVRTKVSSCGWGHLLSCSASLWCVGKST